MLNVLSKLFGRRGDHIETTISIQTLPLKDAEEKEIPRYPPFIKGLPVVPLETILAAQAELIERVRNSLGFTIADFNQLVLPVIQRHAAFVHLLPASEAHHHRAAGGLFQHSLEVAFWTTQTSESVIFSIEGTPRERRENEPRWRLASCFSGLLHDIGKLLSDVSITDKEGAITWNPYSESLHDWATRHSINRYFIRWRDDKRHKRHKQFSTLIVDRIIPHETREFLSASDPSIIKAMLEAISGMNVNQPITKLMLRANQESVLRDLRQNLLDVNEFVYGVPIERYVFDALRRLVKAGRWKVNEPGAKVWHLHQGVFIAWKQLDDLYDFISQDTIPDIPRVPDTLADILIERGFAIPNTNHEKSEGAYYRYWEVLPEMLQKVTGAVKILMLRLESNELIFTTEPPAPVAAKVVSYDEAPEPPIWAVEPLSMMVDLSEQTMSFQKGGIELAKAKGQQEKVTTDDARDALIALLSQFGDATPLLEEAIIPVLDGKKTQGEVLCLMKNQAVILYPEGARCLGNPPEILSKLSQANAIVPDPIMPGRKIHHFGNIKAIVLTEHLSKAVIAAIKEAESTGQKEFRRVAPQAIQDEYQELNAHDNKKRESKTWQ